MLHIRPMKPAQSQAEGGGPAPKSMNQHASSASKADDVDQRRQEDAELVKRLQAGDQAAFRKLFERYQRRAYAVAFGVVKNQHDALDVVQEAFIKVHKHIGTFQGTSSFYTWLYRIVMNLAIDHVRRRHKITEVDDTMKKDDVVVGDGSMVPREVDETSDELPPGTRRLLILRKNSPRRLR